MKMFLKVLCHAIPFCIIAICGTGSIYAQTPESNEVVSQTPEASEVPASNRKIAYKKGKFYAFWGWNRGYYSNSTIHFKGDNYNFKLHNVQATDRPSDISYHNYLQIDRVTIPQTNFRIGYFIKDNLAISLGVDHMKYVMVQNQRVRATGDMRAAGFDSNEDKSIALTENFLTFEHTDGLNYINAEGEYFHQFYKRGIFRLNGHVGAGVGFMLPKTNVQLFGRERHDDFHLAGFGTSVKVGGEVTFWDLFFIRTELKEGFISMPSIRTTALKSDKASQHFFFTQWNYTFGFSWNF